MSPKKKSGGYRGDLILLFIFCTIFGIWSIKDGWFPSEKVMEKHPIDQVFTFRTNGVVSKVMVQVGQGVKEETSMVKLDSEALQETYEAITTSLVEKKQMLRSLIEQGDDYENRDAEYLREQIIELEQSMSDDRGIHQKYVVTSSFKGTVEEVFVAKGDYVEAGQQAVFVTSSDSFYLFNKSMAIICLVVAVLSGAHLLIVR